MHGNADAGANCKALHVRPALPKGEISRVYEALLQSSESITLRPDYTFKLATVGKHCLVCGTVNIELGSTGQPPHSRMRS
jgi:hypothetical protein